MKIQPLVTASFIGCRLITYIFQFVVEGDFSKETSLFNLKIGFDY
jgi:hypothetical protein